jgi:hypothetical protein
VKVRAFSRLQLLEAYAQFPDFRPDERLIV